jgi:benzoyl-CoA reductase/2-hydroxyglutaryl-CoA dehydratase subunit BcrC/BadD/HgdB
VSIPAPPSGLARFEDMVEHALAHATAAKAAGRPVVGILCEYTPREIILAAGGVPVCLCGGSAAMIPAAEERLPASLCPLIKSTFGYSVRRANPFLEMADLLVAETTCDGKKKMYELLAERHPMYVLELPQKPDDPDALAHWTRELHKLRRELEARFRVSIDDASLRAAVSLMNRERGLRRALAGLMRADAPPLSGRELLDLKSLIAAIPDDLDAYERCLRELPLRPAAERPPAGGVRVLLTGVPLPHGAERVIEIVESSGGLVVCQENCTGIKPVARDVDALAADPIAALASAYLHLPCSVMTPNTRRLDDLRRYAREYRAECIVELIWQCCLTYDVESARVRDLAREMDLPYLRIETGYAPSDSARIALRLQALFETVRRAA